MKQFLFITMLIVIISCNQSQNKDEKVAGASDSTKGIKVGGNKMIQIDGKYNVWTKKVGD